MDVRFRRVAMSSQHNRATECFAINTCDRHAHSAHVSWPNIRSMPLTTFYHFSVHPYADLYYYTTDDVPAARDPMSGYPNRDPLGRPYGLSTAIYILRINRINS